MNHAKIKPKKMGETYIRHKGVCLLFVGLFLLTACKGEAESVSIASSVAPQSVPEPVAVVVEEEEAHTREDIDFDELREVNEDVIAWIEVPGTVIDYPVLRGIDNAKYLTTTLEGEYDMYGSIFADMQNVDELTEDVSVLYGHYTTDDTFFTQLHRYKDEDYFEENPNLYLFTPERAEEFEVVAAFTTDNRNIVYEHLHNNPNGTEGFIDWISATTDEAAVLNVEGLSEDDRFLVLSTCVAAVGGANERYIVVSRFSEEL